MTAASRPKAKRRAPARTAKKKTITRAKAPAAARRKTTARPAAPREAVAREQVDLFVAERVQPQGPQQEPLWGAQPADADEEFELEDEDDDEEPL